MNPETWARTVLEPRKDRETDTEADARFLEKHAPANFFDLEEVRWWCFEILARNANRANEKPTVRLPDSNGKGRVARKFRPVRMFTISDYRDRFMQYRESVAADIGAAKKLMAEALAAGHRSLRNEFPEFDPDKG